MLRKVFNRVRLSFKNTKSERVANQAYRDYHARTRILFSKVNIFKKIKKN